MMRNRRPTPVVPPQHVIENTRNATGLFSELAPAALRALASKMKLNLSDPELESIQEYFQSERREPTDTELQAIAQAWSEHCCYKSSKVWLRE